MTALPSWLVEPLSDQFERTHAWQNAFPRLASCYERRITVIEALLDLADTIITVRRLVRRAWTTHRWDVRPQRRP